MHPRINAYHDGTSVTDTHIVTIGVTKMDAVRITQNLFCVSFSISHSILSFQACSILAAFSRILN